MAARPSSLSVSYTAPVITEKEFEQEQQQIDPERASVLEGDLYGTRAIALEPDLDESVAEMHQALVDLPSEEKESYEMALKEAPSLVEQETAPIIFLRCSKYQPRAAARRLARHWDVRCQLFGDRAFLPMVQSEGALTAVDVTNLEQGVAQLLPSDAMERPVLLLSRGKSAQAGAQRGLHNLRAFFYLAHVASQDPIAQRHGMVLIVDQKNADHSSFNRKKLKRFVSYLQEACPLYLNAVHVTYPALKAEAKLYLPHSLWIMGATMRERVRILSGCPNELVIDLMQFHLERYGIPEELGGGFGLPQVLEWLHKRREHESVRGGVGPTVVA